MVKLVILNQGMSGQSLPLKTERTTIGLEKDNSYQISDSSLSAHHCELLLHGNEVHVRDLNSTQGSFINDERITESVLAAGQTLRLGFLELKLEAGTPPPVAPGTASPAKPQSPASASNPPPSWKKKSPILLIAVAVILLGLVIAGAVLLRPPASSPAKLIGWWQLDEGTGTVVKDSSHASQVQNGTLVNNPTWTQGKKGGALEFRGAGQYVSLGNILEDGYPEISLACWVKHSTASWQNIVERSKWDDPDGIGLLMDNSGTSVDFGHYLIHVQSKANVQDDQWHHIVGTLSPQGSDFLYSIYVDGQLDNTMTNAEGLEPSSNGWAIGARYDGSWNYQGLVGDVRIYDHALTPAEVKKLYNGQD